jgi:hypothetical protein
MHALPEGPGTMLHRGIAAQEANGRPLDPGECDNEMSWRFCLWRLNVGNRGGDGNDT